jgi:hypothetical protein
MVANSSSAKAIVHVSGTLLRRAWHSKELNSCIVVRPSGKERDQVAYVVNQVRFSGPSEMVYNTKPRNTPHDPRDKCIPDATEAKGQKADPLQGFVGALPGFDNAIMVYLEADEDAILVQPKSGDQFIPFPDFRQLVGAKKVAVPILDPMAELNC